MRGKNDLQARIAQRVFEARRSATHFAVQFSEDMMLRAAYETFHCLPEELDRLRKKFREIYHERSESIHEDSKWDKKDLWYSSEVNEREMREIMGEYYEEPDNRFWGKV